MRVFMLIMVLLLSGCQSMPPVHTQKVGFAGPPPQGGKVLVNAFHIPKDEPGVTLFYVLGALGGANTQVPFSAAVFDVTDEIRYVGLLDSGSRYYGGGEWLEYDAPLGKRLFMLVAGQGEFPDGRKGRHVDFAEVDVQPGATRSLAISQYGFTKMPYFGEIVMAPEHRQFCQSLQSGGAGKPRDAILSYMQEQGINSNARDFVNYCMATALQRVRVPNEHAYQRFAEHRAAFTALFTERYPDWKKEQKEPPVAYDLMRDYTPKQSAF